MNLNLIADSAKIVSAFVPSNAKQEIQSLIVKTVEESAMKHDEMLISIETLTNNMNDVKAMLSALQTSLPVIAATVPATEDNTLEDVQEAIEDVQDVVEETNETLDKVEDNV